MATKKKFSSFSLLILILVLNFVGLFFVFEASTAESFNTFGHQYHFLQRQALWLGVGLVGMMVIRLVPIKLWQKIAPLVFIGGLGLIFLTLMPGIGLKVNGARRWINLGFTSLQPVELLKLGLIIYFAQWMSQHQRLVPFLFLTAIPSLLLLLQPDMGSLLIIIAIDVALYFLAGGQLKHLLMIGGGGLLLLGLAVVTSDYRMRRLQTFLDPQTDPLGASFHVRQITLALGSGGWLGQGLGNSQQKYAYIPEASSDSIFAIVAEEIGFIGSSVVIFIFFLYFVNLFRIAQQQKPGSYQHLLAMGILVWLASQVCLNLAAVVVLVPLTGLPLPFFSYGGSSLVAVLLANGIVLRIASETKK